MYNKLLLQLCNSKEGFVLDLQIDWERQGRTSFFVVLEQFVLCGVLEMGKDHN